MNQQHEQERNRSTAVNLTLSYSDIRHFDDKLDTILRNQHVILSLLASVVDDGSDKAAAVALAQTVRAKAQALQAAIVTPQP